MRVPGLVFIAMVCGCDSASGPTGLAEVELHYLQDNGAARAVAFQGADGRLIDVVVADASGVAAGIVEDGGMVTVQTSSGYGPIHTFTGVHIGDRLRYDEPDGYAGAPPLGTLSVRVPAAYPGELGTIVDVGGNCHSRVTDMAVTTDVTVTDRCTNPDGTVDVVARGGVSMFSPWTGQPMVRQVVAARPSVVWQPGDTVTLDRWHDPMPITVTIPGAYPDTQVSIDAWLTFDDRPFLITSSEIQAVVGDAVVGGIMIVSGLGDRQLTMVQMESWGDTTWHARRIEQWTAIGSVTLAAADVPPPVDMNISGAGGARPTISWSMDGFGSAAMAEAWLGDADGNTLWTLTVAPELGRVRLPEVPAGLGSAGPPVDAGVVVIGRAGASWDDVRTTWRAPWRVSYRGDETVTWVGQHL